MRFMLGKYDKLDIAIFIFTKGKVKWKELAERFLKDGEKQHISRQLLVNYLKQLRKEGLVKKEIDPETDRPVYVASEDRKEEISSLKKEREFENTVNNVLKFLTPKEKIRLLKILFKPTLTFIFKQTEGTLPPKYFIRLKQEEIEEVFLAFFHAQLRGIIHELKSGGYIKDERVLGYVKIMEKIASGKKVTAEEFEDFGRFYTFYNSEELAKLAEFLEKDVGEFKAKKITSQELMRRAQEKGLTDFIEETEKEIKVYYPLPKNFPSPRKKNTEG